MLNSYVDSKLSECIMIFLDTFVFSLLIYVGKPMGITDVYPLVKFVINPSVDYYVRKPLVIWAGNPSVCALVISVGI